MIDSEKKTLNWGLLATGTIAHKFAAALNAMQDQSNILYACGSRTKEKVESFAAEFGIPEARAYGSYEALLKDPDVDIVYISTPNDSHGTWTRAALEAGKHVLCEKPFVTSSAEARELFGLAAAKGLFLMEGIWTYHLPLIKKAEELIAAGTIGEIVYANAEYGFLSFGARRERKFKSGLGGGALLDIGIYNLAFMHQMLGGFLKEFTGEPKLNEFGTDYFSHIVAEYDCGATVSMTASIGLDLGTPGAVYGTEGKLEFPNYQIAEHMVLTKNNGTAERYDMPLEINGFEYEIRECFNCIAEGKTESDRLPAKVSISHMEELERIRAQWGMKFSFEQ
ncbi:MAG: Gfo/Idh/MocA family oxidoreductase [Eubacteriales bacterium]|nr:Gfo/Idh/MocA family oxidoreductase [Eubacteriales bacterium]